MKRCVVLDAMGVIFEAADDVEELLVPFVAEHGGNIENGTVQSAYLQASLGNIGPDEFWTTVGLSPDLEDAYLNKHRLNPDVPGFLEAATGQGILIWCLSNDVGRWSVKLRDRFELNRYFSGAVISGDIRIRKPDKGIYRRLVEASGFQPGEMVFFDDRDKNISAAQRMGIESRLFTPASGFNGVANLVLGHTL